MAYEAESKKMRTVTVRGVVYLRKEDVVEYLRDAASCEETDTRWRLEEAARHIEQGIQPTSRGASGR